MGMIVDWVLWFFELDSKTRQLEFDFGEEEKAAPLTKAKAIQGEVQEPTRSKVCKGVEPC